MAQLSLHPAPGLNELLPGWFAVPQNPVTRSQEGVTYTPGIGDILRGHFVVPQNPIVNFTSGAVPLIGQQPGAHGGQLNGEPVGMGGCGCGCGGGCGGGMGDISADFSKVSSDISAGLYSQALSDPVMGVPLWGWLTGAVVATMFLAGPSQGPSRISRARRAVKSY